MQENKKRYCASCTYREQSRTFAFTPFIPYTCKYIFLFYKKISSFNWLPLQHISPYSNRLKTKAHFTLCVPLSKSIPLKQITLYPAHQTHNRLTDGRTDGPKHINISSKFKGYD